MQLPVREINIERIELTVLPVAVECLVFICHREASSLLRTQKIATSTTSAVLHDQITFTTTAPTSATSNTLPFNVRYCSLA